MRLVGFQLQDMGVNGFGLKPEALYTAEVLLVSINFNFFSKLMRKCSDVQWTPSISNETNQTI